MDYILSVAIADERYPFESGENGYDVLERLLSKGYKIIKKYEDKHKKVESFDCDEYECEIYEDYEICEVFLLEEPREKKLYELMIFIPEDF